jgi:hypothetical protein
MVSLLRSFLPSNGAIQLPPTCSVKWTLPWTLDTAQLSGQDDLEANGSGSTLLIDDDIFWPKIAEVADKNRVSGVSVINQRKAVLFIKQYLVAQHAYQPS